MNLAASQDKFVCGREDNVSLAILTVGEENDFLRHDPGLTSGLGVVRNNQSSYRNESPLHCEVSRVLLALDWEELMPNFEGGLER